MLYCCLHVRLQFLVEREKTLLQRDREEARKRASAAAAAAAAANAAAQYTEKYMDCPDHALALLSASSSHINRIKQETLAYVGVNLALKQVRYHFITSTKLHHSSMTLF
jgi:hypothetical protein